MNANVRGYVPLLRTDDQINGTNHQQWHIAVCWATFFLMKNTLNREALGKLFTMMRETKGLTQQDVADKVGLSLKHYNEIEKGKNGGFDTIMGVLNFYGCKIKITTPPLTATLDL